jgi:isopenicillin-N epimerase
MPVMPAPPDPAAPWSEHARHWALDPAIAFLNHGSFGACPRPVLAAQQRWRERLEAEPVRFMVRELEPALDAARAALAAFVGARPQDLVFVPNATAGVSTVLASLALQPGDELLTTDHAYNACRNALERTAARSGARVVSVRVPFPLRDADEAVAPLLAAATPRTRLALLDHVTSPTGLVLPVERLVPALQARGIDVLVDGAHAPGMLPLDLSRLGAAYYTGNAHKWLCAPKGCALLHVRADRQAGLAPLVTSHGANSPRTDRSRFQLEFDWPGTHDPTPYLVLPEALQFLGGLLPGGWPALQAANRGLALRARDLLCAALGVPPPAPDAMLGSLAAVPLPDGDGRLPGAPLFIDPLQERLFREHAIEVPVFGWPAPPKRLIRVAVQAYNTLAQYERLARALGPLCSRPAAARPAG